ncbi:hypothetical protein HC891_14025 [Candidatus Gracilibacteria bacterium]|nr:hypothetical protein [Candidatus Gracilibacteria bacterium]
MARCAGSGEDRPGDGSTRSESEMVVIPRTTWEVLRQRLQRVNAQWPSRDVHFVLRILRQYEPQETPSNDG